MCKADGVSRHHCPTHHCINVYQLCRLLFWRYTPDVSNPARLPPAFLDPLTSHTHTLSLSLSLSLTLSPIHSFRCTQRDDVSHSSSILSNPTSPSFGDSSSGGGLKMKIKIKFEGSIPSPTSLALAAAGHDGEFAGKRKRAPYGEAKSKTAEDQEEIEWLEALERGDLDDKGDVRHLKREGKKRMYECRMAVCADGFRHTPVRMHLCLCLHASACTPVCDRASASLSVSVSAYVYVYVSVSVSVSVSLCVCVCQAFARISSLSTVAFVTAFTAAPFLLPPHPTTHHPTSPRSPSSVPPTPPYDSSLRLITMTHHYDSSPLCVRYHLRLHRTSRQKAMQVEMAHKVAETERMKIMASVPVAPVALSQEALVRTR